MNTVAVRVTLVSLSMVQSGESADAQQQWISHLHKIGLKLLPERVLSVAEAGAYLDSAATDVVQIIQTEELGYSASITAQLERFLGSLKDNVKCVLFTLTDGIELARRAAQIVPMAIGTRVGIRDQTTFVYTSAFYDYLSRAESYLAAHSRAQSCIAFHGGDPTGHAQLFRPPAPTDWVFRSMAQRDAMHRFASPRARLDDCVALLQAPTRFGKSAFLRQLRSEGTRDEGAPSAEPPLRQLQFRLGWGPAEGPAEPECGREERWFRQQGEHLHKAFHPEAAAGSAVATPDALALLSAVRALVRPYWEASGRPTQLVIKIGELEQQRQVVYRLFEKFHSVLTEGNLPSCGLRVLFVSRYPLQAFDSENFTNKTSIRLEEQFVLGRLPAVVPSAHNAAEPGADVTYQVASKYWTRSSALDRGWLGELWSCFSGHPDLLWCAVTELDKRPELSEAEYLARLQSDPASLSTLSGLVQRRAAILDTNRTCLRMFRRLIDDGRPKLLDGLPDEEAMALCTLYRYGLVQSVPADSDFRTLPNKFQVWGDWLPSQVERLMRHLWVR